MARFVESEGGAQNATPGEHPGLSPEVWLCFNVTDDMVEIRKIINGTTFTRLVRDDTVVDHVVDHYVKYHAYTD